MFTDAAADVAPPPSPDDDPRATSLGRVDARDDDDDPPDEIRDRLRHVQEACDATTVDAPFPTLDLSGSHHAGDAIERVTCFGDAVVRGLRTLRLEFALRLEDSHVAALAPSATLEDVNLNGAQSVGDDAVIAIARANPGLRDIGLYWNVRVTDDAIATLCASCPALRSINLSGCKRLTDASAKSLSKLRRVESLNLTRCAFTDDGLTAIVLSPGIADHLVSLNLYAAARYTSRAYRCVGVLSQLTFLDVCGSQEISDDAVAEIAEGCPLLEYLNMSWCNAVTDVGFVAVAEGCPRLRIMSAHGNRNVTSAFVNALARTGDGSLRTLDVCGCVGVAEDRRALRALLPSLHEDDRTAFVFHT